MDLLKIEQFKIITTAHKDVTERLQQLNPSLASKARRVLDVNKAERHIRGGMATRIKYQYQHIHQCEAKKSEN